MNLFSIFRRERRSNQPNATGLFAAAWDVLSNTHGTPSGEPINETIALQHVSVYAATRIIAESVGSMTLRTYQRLPRGRKEAVDNPIHRMLSISPNDEMSAPVMWESVAGCMALTGNSYVEILRNKEGSPVGLYPLHPRMTEPVRLPTGKLAFKTAVGVTNGQTRIIASADMLHFPLFSWDGLKGLSPIQQAKDAIGLARAAEKSAARFHGNGSRPGGLLTPVGQVDPTELNNFREFWERANSGENQGRVGVLPQDWKYTALGLSPEESQWLQTRQLSRTDIAALYRLPPSMLGDTARLSNANHEQQSLQLVTDTLRPYLVRIEKEIARKLLPDDGSIFAEFDVSERLRGDFKSTMDGFAVGKQWGFYSTNTILEKLGENPIGPEGDVLWAPVNMTNAANLIPKAPDPAPLPLLDPPTPPTEQQRSLLANYVPAFSGLFADGIGRITARSKRDEAVGPILSPLLDSMTSIITTEARSEFKLPDDWTPTKPAADYLKGAATRSAEWTVEGKDQAAGSELTRAVRSLHYAIYRDASAAVAKRKLDA